MSGDSSPPSRTGHPRLVVSVNGDVSALEGRGYVAADGRTYLLSKGARTTGWDLDQLRVLDSSPGYGKQCELADRFRRHMSETVPDLNPVDDTFPDVPEYGPDDEPPSAIAAAYLTTHPGFGDGPVPGCLFLVTDKQTSTDPGRTVLNGYFWAPDDSGLYSESSSMYAADLDNQGGQVVGYQSGSMTFASAWKTLPADRPGAYRAVLGL